MYVRREITDNERLHVKVQFSDLRMLTNEIVDRYSAKSSVTFIFKVKYSKIYSSCCYSIKDQLRIVIFGTDLNVDNDFMNIMCP